jgi:polysaccharide export outer membrane protein
MKLQFTSIFLLAGALSAAAPAFAQDAAPATSTIEPLNKAAYRVGPGDILEITAGPSAALQESIARSEPVGPDGRISFDLIGSVYVEDKTSDEIDAEITKLLSEYIKDVEVTVIIAGYEARRVFVLGEVGRPGPYLIKKNMTIMDAISEAGTPTRKAKLSKVKLIKGYSTASNQQILDVDVRKIMKNGELNRNLSLADGDIIMVQPDGLSKVGYFMEKVFAPLRPLFLIGVATGLIRYAF